MKNVLDHKLQAQYFSAKKEVDTLCNFIELYRKICMHSNRNVYHKDSFTGNLAPIFTVFT